MNINVESEMIACIEADIREARTLKNRADVLFLRGELKAIYKHTSDNSVRQQAAKALRVRSVPTAARSA